jgi:hypothetical protein
MSEPVASVRNGFSDPPRLRPRQAFGALVKARTFGMTPFKTESNLSIFFCFLPVDLAGDFVLMSDYTGKEVVE